MVGQALTALLKKVKVNQLKRGTLQGKFRAAARLCSTLHEGTEEL